MSKNLKIGLVLFFLLQVLLAASFELAHDEAYYWLFSLKLDWGFFDHPPFVAVLIKTFSFLPKSELTVRLGFVVLQFASLLLLLKLVSPHRRNLACLIFLSFPLASIGGLFALPDIPLLFMTVVYCYFLKEYLESTRGRTPWVLGFSISLLLMAKYHGILLVFFTLLAIPRLFLRKDFYLVTGVALLGCIPHFLWQYRTGFMTLQYHFVDRPGAGLSVARLAEYVVGQIFLAGLLVGPLVWLANAVAKPASGFERALKCISFGSVIFFFISCFSKKVEANWTIFLVPTLTLLAVQSHAWDRKLAKRLLWTSVVLLLIARFALVLPLSKPKRLLEFHGWETWAKQIEQQCQAPIMANTYQLASKLSFYLEKPIHAINYRSRRNQFDLWPRDPDYYQGNEVCFVSDKRQYSGPEILTPEGKRLFLKDHQSLTELIDSK